MEMADVCYRVRNQVWDQLDIQMRAQVTDRVRSKVWFQVWGPAMSEEICDQVYDYLLENAPSRAVLV
jgi:hypothetical protein